MNELSGPGWDDAVEVSAVRDRSSGGTTSRGWHGVLRQRTHYRTVEPTPEEAGVVSDRDEIDVVLLSGCDDGDAGSPTARSVWSYRWRRYRKLRA